MKTIAIALIVAEVLIGSAQGRGFVSGAKLVRQAAVWSRVQESDRSPLEDQLDAARFEAYIEGAMEGGEGREWCGPKDMQANVAWGLVANYIARHPEVGSESGYAVLQDTFSNLWPCPTQ